MLLELSLIALQCLLNATPKLPGAGLPGNNANVVRDFFNEIRLLRSIRGCSGVIKLAGIVLDDARKQLMSYLYKAPALGKVRDI